MRPFDRILYVSEPLSAQQGAVQRAVTLAQNNQARLDVIEVTQEVTAGVGMPPGGPISADLTAAALDQRHRALESLFAPHRGQADISIQVLTGRRFIEVTRAVLREAYDLVIKPAENPGWLDRLFGSDDMHLLRECPCPVWLLKPTDRPKYTRVLAAVDIDPNQADSDDEQLSRQILDIAGWVALADFAELHIVHAWDAPAAEFASMWADDPEGARRGIIEGARLQHRAGIERLTRDLQRRIGDEAYRYLAPRTHLPKGITEEVIPALARDLEADLVVMGTVARTGIPGLLIGNTAEALLDQLECAVLTTKPPGFVSSVTLD